MTIGESIEDRVELIGTRRCSGLGIAGLRELVRVGRDLQPIADVRIGMVTKPRRWLHDVRVGVVNPSAFDVGHRDSLA